MTVAWKATGTRLDTAFGSTNPAPVLPTGWAAGDFAVALYSWGSGQTISSGPTGWTRAGSITPSMCAMYFRKLQAGDANPTLTLSGNCAKTSIVVTFTGLGTPMALDVAVTEAGQVSGNPGSATPAAATPANDAALGVLAFFGNDNRRWSTVTGAGWTHLFDYDSDEGVNTRLAMDWRVCPNPAASVSPFGASLVGPTPYPGVSGIFAVFTPIILRTGNASDGATGQGDMMMDPEVGPVTHKATIAWEGHGNMTIPKPVVYKDKHQKPRRELVWVHDYLGERVMVVD